MEQHVRALVIDDERLARAALKRMLRNHPDVELAGEAANVDEAARQIRELHPDVIFLDIEMPGTNGLELVDGMPDSPLIVFTTAYTEHAVRAFEVNALDYLVKPILAERLGTALNKVRKAIADRQVGLTARRQLLLREGLRSWLVPMDRILFLESEGNYTRVYFDDHRPLIYTSLTAVAARLDPALFFRVSRLHIVNLQKVASLDRQPGGRCAALIVDGPRVDVSRRRWRTLRRLLDSRDTASVQSDRKRSAPFIPEI